MANNRETVRDYLAGLLNAALVGTGKPCQVTYNYPRADILGQTPLVDVASRGSYREHFTGEGTADAFYFDITTLVLYSDGSTWNEDDAEDKLDAIDAAIADVLEANRRVSGYWRMIEQDGKSERVNFLLNGCWYAREATPIKVTL